jgi:hypothetical protein
VRIATLAEVIMAYVPHIFAQYHSYFAQCRLADQQPALALAGDIVSGDRYGRPP